MPAPHSTTSSSHSITGLAVVDHCRNTIGSSHSTVDFDHMSATILDSYLKRHLSCNLT